MKPYSPQGVNPRLDAIGRLLPDLSRRYTPGIWEHPLPGLWMGETDGRRAIIQAETPHPDAIRLSWHAIDRNAHHETGDPQGADMSAYTTLEAGEHVARLLDRLDQWLATGNPAILTNH